MFFIRITYTNLRIYVVREIKVRELSIFSIIDIKSYFIISNIEKFYFKNSICTIDIGNFTCRTVLPIGSYISFIIICIVPCCNVNHSSLR